ncbi:MAG: tetratricopeptide repeat protein, partial [Reyranella sp.]|nr:tetratricopeptide repeat protein [Reyranella sp.]
MYSSKFWSIALTALVAFAAAPTAAVANDAEACERQSGDHAIAACSSAIASGRYTGDKLAVLYAERGDAWGEKGDHGRAIADFDEAIKLAPKYAHAYNHRGITYLYMGDHDRAIADFDEAIKLAPKYAHAYTDRGSAWNEKGDFDRAIADHDQAIKLEPKYADAYTNRGDAWYNKGDYRRAIADYSEALKLKPDVPHALNHRGMAYASERNYDRAIADFDEAIKLAPKYAHAYDNRSEAWSSKGDFGRAIADFSEASRLKPKNAACAPEAGRVIDCIRPSATDPAIQRFDSPHYVVFNDRTGPDADLLVFLPGTDGRPPGPVPFLKAAADAGYRAISLATNDVPAVAQYCPRRPDPACSGQFRRMRIYGDGTTLDPAIDNTAAESIVNRLVKLLQYLDRQEPQRKWGQYLENGTPKWSRIALAGQSQGAGMAAFIAQAHEVARVILFSSPWDFTETKGHADKLAPWLSGPSKTPLQRWYAGYHEKEDTAALIARAYAALRIPPDHIRVFKRDLPVSPQVARRKNLYHGQGLTSPAYVQDRAFFLGRS